MIIELGINHPKDIIFNYAKQGNPLSVTELITPTANTTTIFI